MTSYSPAATAYALLYGEDIELPHRLTPMLPAERDDVAQVLRQRYLRNASSLPGPAPDFHATAAVYGFECFVAAAHEWYTPPGTEPRAAPAPVPLASGHSARDSVSGQPAQNALPAQDAPSAPNAPSQPSDEPQLPRYTPHSPNSGPTAAELLSADLCLGYLVTLRNQIAGRYLDDLLVKAIDRTLAPWAYTALLLPEAPPPRLGDWWHHPTLRHLYVDRLVERSQLGPAEVPEVAEAVATALGAHAAELWPGFAEAQKRRTSPA